MLDDLIEVEEDKLPKLTDPKMEDWAQELGREWEAFDKARDTLQREIWGPSDRAYMAIKDEMPCLPAMKFIDNGMLGDPGVRNAIKQARDSLISSVLPADESWLEPVKMNDEDDDGTILKTKNLMISKFHEANIRNTAPIAFDQLFARGITAIGLDWQTLRTVHRVPKKMSLDLKDIADELMLTDEDGKPLFQQSGDAKYWKTVFNGPRTYAIDMHCLWLDPTSSLGNMHREMPFIHLSFKSMVDLKNAKNRMTGEKLYDQEVLKDVEEWTYEDYYKDRPFACETTRLMGLNPGAKEMGKFVPVFLFYKQVREFCGDGDDIQGTYVDKYFYVAQSNKGKKWRIIRVQENPSKRGVRPFYVVNNDPYLGSPYGVSLAEKALSALRAKDLIDSISLNVAVMQANPANFFIGNVLKDDKKPKLTPGSNQEIVMRPGVGLEWIKPYPMNPATPELNLQQSRHYGDMIATGTGVRSAQTITDPTRSMGKDPTATEIRQTSADAATGDATIATRVADNLMEPLANGMHDLCRENYTEEQRFVVNGMNGATPTSETITPEELNRDRFIKIVGRRAIANKGSIIQNCIEALKILANPMAAQVVNNLPVILQDIIFKVISEMNIPVKDEYRLTPEEIFARDPKVQLEAVQGALQNPQMREQIAMEIAQSPDGQAALEQMKNEAIQQHESMKGPQGGKQ